MAEVYFKTCWGILRCNRSLLQNALGVTMWGRSLPQNVLGNKKCDGNILQNPLGIQNATEIYQKPF